MYYLVDKNSIDLIEIFKYNTITVSTISEYAITYLDFDFKKVYNFKTLPYYEEPTLLVDSFIEHMMKINNFYDNPELNAGDMLDFHEECYKKFKQNYYVLYRSKTERITLDNDRVYKEFEVIIDSFKLSHQFNNNKLENFFIDSKILFTNNIIKQKLKELKKLLKNCLGNKYTNGYMFFNTYEKFNFSIKDGVVQIGNNNNEEVLFEYKLFTRFLYKERLDIYVDTGLKYKGLHNFVEIFSLKFLLDEGNNYHINKLNIESLKEIKFYNSVVLESSIFCDFNGDRQLATDLIEN